MLISLRERSRRASAVSLVPVPVCREVLHTGHGCRGAGEHIPGAHASLGCNRCSRLSCKVLHRSCSAPGPVPLGVLLRCSISPLILTSLHNSCASASPATQLGFPCAAASFRKASLTPLQPHTLPLLLPLLLLPLQRPFTFWDLLMVVKCFYSTAHCS